MSPPADADATDRDDDDAAPADTFALVGSEVRAAIRQALRAAWELRFAATDRQLTVESRDPWRVPLTLEADVDRRSLTVGIDHVHIAHVGLDHVHIAHVDIDHVHIAHVGIDHVHIAHVGGYSGPRYHRWSVESAVVDTVGVLATHVPDDVGLLVRQYPRRPMTQPGEDTDDGGADRRLAPADAFALLGEPSRLAIVTTLHRAEPGEKLAFSDLYDRVDVDGTGKFNYHLDELVGHFVARGQDGYDLTAAGRRIARAVAAGIYTDAPRKGPVVVEGSCYACDAADLVASYVDERFAVDCRSCGESVLSIRVPPSVVRDRDPAGAVDAVERWSRAQVDRAIEGL